MSTNASWGWRKLLQIRSDIRRHVVSQVDNGQNTLAWDDIWTDMEPLSNWISNREIKQAGYQLLSKVADLFDALGWNLTSRVD